MRLNLSVFFHAGSIFSCLAAGIYFSAAGGQLTVAPDGWKLLFTFSFPQFFLFSLRV